MAVYGAVIDVDLIIIGRIHQRVAAAHHAGRLAVVRESAGYAAYRAGHYEIALKELQKRVKAYYKNPPKKKFAYAVGHYWDKDKDSVGCYTYHSEVHSGTMEEAENFLKMTFQLP